MQKLSEQSFLTCGLQCATVAFWLGDGKGCFQHLLKKLWDVIKRQPQAGNETEDTHTHTHTLSLSPYLCAL